MTNPYDPSRSDLQAPSAPPSYGDAPQQYQAGYPQANYYVPVPTDGFSIAALVLGLLGFNVIAVVFGIIGLSRTANGVRTGRGMAIAGIVLGSIGTIVAILLVMGLVGLAAFY